MAKRVIGELLKGRAKQLGNSRVPKTCEQSEIIASGAKAHPLDDSFSCSHLNFAGLPCRSPVALEGSPEGEFSTLLGGCEHAYRLHSVLPFNRWF